MKEEQKTHLGRTQGWLSTIFHDVGHLSTSSELLSERSQLSFLLISMCLTIHKVKPNVQTLEPEVMSVQTLISESMKSNESEDNMEISLSLLFRNNQ
jgi:hypothetical protein